MSARKVGLLLLILSFGGALEGVWTVRDHLDIGAAGCRVLGGRFEGPSFTFEEKKSLDVPSPLRVEVANGFGAVAVMQGSAGAAEVTLRKTVFLGGEDKARAFSERIALETTVDGSTLRLGTNRVSLERTDSRVGFETHFEVRVPPGTSVKVVNDHGAVDVRDVAAAEVEGSFDAVRVERVLGDARVSGRHGDVSVSGVTGSLTLSSRFGETKVNDVKGPSRLESEHGDVTTDETGHLSLDIKQGDASIEGVTGDLEVHGEHAAAKVQRVSGRATVTTSYNDVDLKDVGGEVRVTVDHGGLEAQDLKGTLQAELSFGDATLQSVAGAVDLKTDHGGVHAKGLEGGARIRASGDDVALEGFRGPVDIEVHRGSVDLAPAGPVSEAVTVTTVNGGVRLEVPKGSRFELLASSSRGDVLADLPSLVVKERSPSRVAATLGEGGGHVTLSADHGDIVLTPREEVAER